MQQSLTHKIQMFQICCRAPTTPARASSQTSGQRSSNLNVSNVLQGPDHPYTRLIPDLKGGVDPDDVFSKVPYEKGFWFLYYLQVRKAVVFGLGGEGGRGPWAGCEGRGRQEG